MNKLLVMASVAIFLGACTKSDSTQHPDADTHQIKASSSIEGATKAIVVTDDVLADINFLRLNDAIADKTTFDFRGKTEIVGARATGGDITLTPVQSYELDNKTVYLRGYHPKGTVTAATNTVWTIDGATDILLTDVWNAGNYTTPITAGMTFRHQLARVEVICQADASVAVGGVQSVWGDIEYVKFVGAKPEMTYDYAKNLIEPTGTPADFTLLNGGSYAAGAFTSVAIQAAADAAITASAMLPPVASASIKLTVKTANKTEQEISIKLSANLTRAMIHKVTLTFKADGKEIAVKASTIEGWTPGAGGGGDVTE